jgi:glutathione synthase/RimK-type ligase-like ATP-grasp enzyme
MILIVSFHDNPHVQAVLQHVNRPVTVFDVAEFPSRASIEVSFGDGIDRLRLMADGRREIPIEDIGAVWYRRERPLELDPALTDPTSRLFAWSESTEALTGVWRALDCFWMNPPAADEAGHRKVRQLQLARRVGLQVPETLITNDPSSARAFAVEHLEHGVIRKALRNIAQAPRSTALVTAEDLARIGDVRYAPVTFQRFVPADLDLRVIVVEDEIFATAIKSEPEYQTDYRMGLGSAEFSPYTLPDDVASALLELHHRLGLVYGASDFRVTPDGEHVFLEVNPAGEYLFASERTGQPVPQAIAACLERHDRGHNS